MGVENFVHTVIVDPMTWQTIRGIRPVQ